MKTKTKEVWAPDRLIEEPYKRGIQTIFLESDEDLVGLDGGKGSGKTDLLIVDCLRTEKIFRERWHGVIFRREYKRLVEVIDRAHYFFKKLPQFRAHWQGDDQRFKFEHGGWLAFHNCEHVGDEQKYQGWEITDLKFDQLEEFTEDQFDFLLKQNRSGVKDLPATVRWTANPLGVGHGWIKRRFVDGKRPTYWDRAKDKLMIGPTYEMVIEEDGVKARPLTYKRIFGTVFDNPVLGRDERYIQVLRSDPNPIRRKAFLQGDWNVVMGQFFDNFATEVHVLDPSVNELPKEWRRKGGMDYGNVKVMHILAKDYEGNLYVEWEFRTEPSIEKPHGYVASEYAEMSAEWMLERGLGEGLFVVGDNNMWSAVGRDVGTAETPVRIIQAIWNDRFRAKGKRPPQIIAVSKKRTEEYRWRLACNEAMRNYLRYEYGADGKIRLHPRIYFLDRCRSIASTLPSLSADPNNPTDIADGQDDHDYDSVKMCMMSMITPREADIAEVPHTFEQYVDQIINKLQNKGNRVKWRTL